MSRTFEFVQVDPAVDTSGMTAGDALDAIRLTCELAAMRAAIRRGQGRFVADRMATVRRDLSTLSRRYALEG